MRKVFVSALTASAVMLGIAGFANASSHSAAARAETKLLLNNAVEAVCLSGVQGCAGLRKAAADLYKDPLVVTRDDLARIDTLKAALTKYDTPTLKVRLASARNDLATAIDRAETLTAHVFYLHEGKWEQLELCEMPA